MSNYERRADEWTWREGGTHYAVRWFRDQGTLVWSSWHETGEGPKFAPGHKQTIADFLAHGPAWLAPSGLADAVRAALTEPTQKTWWSRWRRSGNT